MTNTEFIEQAALDIPNVLSADGGPPREMRHQPHKMALSHLLRFSNFGNYHHYGSPHGGVWVPKDLRAGQIVRCDLPTDFNQDNNPELYPRNCLFLGFETDLETGEPIAARLMRFSYQTDRRKPQTEPLLDIYNPAFRDYAVGLKQPALLRSGSSIDIVPFSGVYWGHYVHVEGFLKEAGMQDIKKVVGIAEKSRNFNRAAELRNYGSADTKALTFLPSMDPRFANHYHVFDLAETKDRDINQLSADELEDLHNELLIAHIQKSFDRREQIKFERGITSAFRKKEEAERQDLKATIRELRRKHNSITPYTENIILRRALRELEERDNDVRVALADEIEASDVVDNTLNANDLPTTSELLDFIYAQWQDESSPEAAVEIAAERQAASPDSLEMLANLGLGGWKRASDIHLPEHLWRGRFHMLRIPNLLRADELDDTTNRPCALWRAWARPDEHGDLQISHMEFIPCTRMASEHFDYKMKVKPLDTTVKMPTFLIAEMSMILEVSAANFQPVQPGLGTFYELLPNQVRELLTRRELASEKKGIQFFGMKPDDIPSDCIEVPLPNPPGDKARKLLVKRNVKFTPTRSGPYRQKTKKRRFPTKSNGTHPGTSGPEPA